MKQWAREIEINKPLDDVWQLLNGPVEDMQKIMPNLLVIEPLVETEDVIGNVYLQQYKEGKTVQKYEVKTIEYLDQSDHKKLTVRFMLSNKFEITTGYEVKKMDEATTFFRYTTANDPLKWYLKPLLFLVKDKVVLQFVERVKRVAEEENNKGTTT